MYETDIFLQYLKNSDGIKYYTEYDRLWLESFVNEISVKFYSFDSPDVIIETPTKFILLEHYQFDSSTRKKGSSLLKEEEAQKDREYKSKIDSIQSNDNVTDISYHTSFESDISLDNYIKNLIDSFNKHILKYDDYVNHFISETKNLTKDIEFGFIIQNTSILPDAVHKDIKIFPLTPFHISEFRNKLKQFPQVKHVFFLMEDLGELNKKLIHYSSYTSLDELESIFPNLVHTYKFIPWKPRHSRHTVFIPKK